MAFRLLDFYRHEAGAPQLAIVGSSLASGLSRGLLLTVINAAAEQVTEQRFLWWHLAAFALLMLLYLGSSYHSLTRVQIFVEQMTQRLRLRIIDKLLFAQLRFVESREDGHIYARLTQDINQLSSAAVTLVNTFQAGVLLFFCLIYIGWLSPLGLLATLLTIFAGVATYLKQNRTCTDYTRQVRRKEVEFFGAIGDTLDGFKELKINRAKNVAIDRHISGISDLFRQLSIRAETLFTISFLTSQTFMFLMMAILVFVLPFASEIDATLIFQFLAALLFLIGPLEAVVSSIPRITRANVALENVQRLEQELEQTIAENENREREVTPIAFEQLRFNQVGFSFSGEQSDDVFALGPVDLQLQRGEIVFLVGGNGSGKTTLVKLLTGLYLPTEGEIIVNGRTLQQHDYQAYREMFTTIFGDFHLFRRLYGVTEINQELLDDLLTRLDLANKTHYEEGRFTSVNLSTGQRKRLAFITSYLEDKQIFVFDEFAADQDPHFRQLFYRTLLPELKSRGKTIIAVSHDDNYFDSCDRLIKLDYGKIIHDGPPKQISAQEHE